MNIIELFDDKINEVLSTFDRMIIKGHLQSFYNFNSRMYYLHKQGLICVL